ncbi:RNA polymerase sigma factor [Actinopolymorpha rutila]|uniref:RNA polymerase sigma-70 factor (ECF subfamily) n=1 Tax=Actinopolymorpha rutila TaxID=446787 RepID=A0A852Z6G8_9ACTN|nr:RNA polymerase sigma-70 factor (ECF subfamily) [Actinopolymorpha rutila]
MNEDQGIGSIGTDPDRFEVFYREHLDAVQRFVARRVDDPHTAADLTADIFVAVIESATSYRAGLGPPRAWVFGIARNVVAMEHRRSARYASAVGRLEGRRVLEADALERAMERIDAAQNARRLHGQLQELAPGLRAVFELVSIDGLSVADAAAVLKISPGNARVRLHRARRQLARSLDLMEAPPEAPTETAAEAPALAGEIS